LNSKFFTNKDSNTLENRLKDILSTYEIENIEFLIGYFRISGFKKIAPLLENIKKARILIGINIDKITLEAKQKGVKLNSFDYEKFINEFTSKQKKVLSEENYTKEVDESIYLLIKMLYEKKLEIKISKSKNIHAKIYILREKEKIRHNKKIEYTGSIITGSSNLSENGLSKNYEFNVELKDSDDIEFTLNEFDSLWIDAIEINKKDIEDIKQKTYLREITPYEVYIKFLIEHFQDRIEYDPSVANDLPKGYMKLAYQIDAVNEGLAKIKKHNGFFLSDVVGLGKTITSAMIVKRLCLKTKGEILIIAPPSIKQEWEETFNKFKIGSSRAFVFVSFASLDKIKDTTKYEIIIIDESHKFKNFSTSRYKELEIICKEQIKYKKKIILISATPLNNKPQDIANQLYLFQDKRDSSIDSYPNLEIFFAKINKSYKSIIGKKENQLELTPIELQKLKELSEEVRDNILREVMVRRTRSDIQSEFYKKDLKEQKLLIPIIKPIIEIEYKLNDNLLKIFNETIDLLTDEKIGLQYHRYKILSYLNSDGLAKYGKIQKGFIELSSQALAKLMQTMLIKRLESSFFAFKSTINKQKRNLSIFLDMFEKGDIYIPIKSFKIYDLIEQDEENFMDNIDNYIKNEKMKAYIVTDFDKEYVNNLKNDLKILEKIVKLWQNIDYDPKLDKLKEILEKNKKNTIIIFTESKQTALYLKDKLSNNKKILTIHGDNRQDLKETIRENFDARYNKQKNKYNILITTDTLSEGVNMHRANIIYNYDIPWNSTRLMQRIGRINRIGTIHNEIHIYNFKPTAQSEELIELSKKAFIKLQSFHYVVGEDSKIYSEKEEVSSVSLYEPIQEKPNEELKFLEEIRKYKTNNPKNFKNLKNLPNKIRVQRKKDILDKTTFVFIANNESKNYYQVDDTNCKAVNFINMASCLKSNEKEKAINPINNFHYEHVKTAIEFYENELIGIISQSNRVEVKHKIDNQSIRLLKSWSDKELISKDNFNIFIKTIKLGKLQNLSKDILNISKKFQHHEIKNKMKSLQNKYKLLDIEKNKTKRMDIKIILSETFI
jgi:superfamily II DNA/RNA helicase